jgi:LysR family hydrogen peroxide-inducible transcriptional activator
MKLPPISLRDLEYVIAVGELKCFSAAAEKCAVSQPSLSAQVRKIEEWAGIKLFERTTRRVIVTEVGQRFIEHAQRVLAEVRELAVAAEPVRRPFGGTLRLSAIATLGPYFFPRVLGHLKSTYPDLAIVLGEGKTADLLLRLRDGTLDAVLLSPPFEDDAFESISIFREPFLVAGAEGNEGEKAEKVWLSLPANRRLVLEEGHCLRHQALARCSEGGRQDRHGTSLETLKYMVAAGEGYTLVPMLAATNFEGVCYSEPSSDAFSREIILVWRKSDTRGQQYGELAESLRSYVREKLPQIEVYPVGAVQ